MNQLKIRWILILSALVALLFTLLGCGHGDADDDDTNTDTDDDESNDDDNDETNGDLVLNEIDCHGRDWVEIVNTSSEEMDLAGWYVADDLTADGHQYELPAGSVIQPAEHFVVKQEEDSEVGFEFGLKCAADTVYLLDSAMNVVAQVSIGETPDGSTWGRLPDITGEWRETSPTKGAENQEPYSSSASLFDPLGVNTVNITLADDAITALTGDPYEFVEGQIQVVSGGVTSELLTVGIRLKSGESFRPIGDKASFKIKINAVDTTARLFGLKGFSLNNMIDDPTMMHETLAYTMYRNAGLPAIRAGYAWVKVNGEARGLYATIENYDDIFTAFQFDDTQHVYEGTADLDSTHVGQIDVDEGDAADKQDLLNLVAALNDTANGQWMATVAEILDLELFLDYWVLENYIGQTDGYALAANNYFLHSDEAGYFTMMPWGADRSFIDKPAFPSGSSVICARCLAIAGCLELYETALADLTPVIAAMDLDALVEEMSTVIDSHVRDDEFMDYTVAQQQAAVEALRTYLAGRPTEAGVE